MHTHDPNLTLAYNTIVAEIRQLMSNYDTPFLVALDGGSGCGKSTLALMLAEKLEGGIDSK